jgi:hypothetical protein
MEVPFKHWSKLREKKGRSLRGTVGSFYRDIYIERSMRIELIVFGITAFLMANIYTDGKYWKLLQTNQKYYKMAGIALGGLMIYVLFKKFPSKAHDIIRGSNEYIKYLPIDKSTVSMLNPILDFTSKQNIYNENSGSMPILPMGPNRSIDRLVNSGKVVGGGDSRGGDQGVKATKRSVSETKKKFVASRQNWKCNDCKEQLSAWFEVDHITRLEYGGSNHIDNLVALCRECHGRKTTMENL